MDVESLEGHPNDIKFEKIDGFYNVHQRYKAYFRIIIMTPNDIIQQGR